MRSGTYSSGRLKSRKYYDGLILGELNVQNGGHIYSTYTLSFSLRIDAAELKISNIFASFSKFVERFCVRIRVVSRVLGNSNVGLAGITRSLLTECTMLDSKLKNITIVP